MTFADEIMCNLSSVALPLIKEVEEIWEKTEPNSTHLMKRKAKYIEKFSIGFLEDIKLMKEQELLDVRNVEKSLNSQEEERLKLKSELMEEITHPPSDLKLYAREKFVRLDLIRLKAAKREKMEKFFVLIEQKESLESCLDIDETIFEVELIPDKRTEQSLSSLIEELIQEKECREQHMYAMYERITELIDILGYDDLNSTSVANIVGLDKTMLTQKSLKKAQQFLRDLEAQYEVKLKELKCMVDNIQKMYTRLAIPEMDQLSIATGSVFPVEKLIIPSRYLEIQKEEEKMQALKLEKLDTLIEKEMQNLETSQKIALKSAKEIEEFQHEICILNKDSRLEAIEHEIESLNRFMDENADILKDIHKVIQLHSLAEDLKQRMSDPNRLFKARGNLMMKEEEDRKIVSKIPTICNRILSYNKDILVFGEHINVLVKRYRASVEDHFPSKTKKISKASRAVSSRSVQAVTKSGSVLTRSAASKIVRSASNLDLLPRADVHHDFGHPKLNSTAIRNETAYKGCGGNCRINFGDESTLLSFQNNIPTNIPGPAVENIGPTTLAVPAIRSRSRRPMRRSKSFSDLQRAEGVQHQSRRKSKTRRQSRPTNSPTTIRGLPVARHRAKMRRSASASKLLCLR